MLVCMYVYMFFPQQYAFFKFFNGCLGKKQKNVSFYGVCMYVRPKLTFVSLFFCFFCTFPSALYFSWKKNHIFGWDGGILGSNNLMNWWDVTSPFMYCVFHHISDHLQRLILFFANFTKKLGFCLTPPLPCWDKIPSLAKESYNSQRSDD